MFPVPIIGFFVCNIYDLLRDQSRAELERLGQNQELLCLWIYVDKKRSFYVQWVVDFLLHACQSESIKKNYQKHNINTKHLTN